METKLTEILEKTSFILIIILLIESMTKYAFFPLIFVYTPIAVISLILFFIECLKIYSNSFGNNENIKYGNYLKLSILVIFTFEIVTLALLHIIVCSCGHFIVNPVPIILVFLLNIGVYHIIIKKDILEKVFTGKKLLFYIVLFLAIIIISVLFGKLLYSHPSILFAEE